MTLKVPNAWYKVDTDSAEKTAAHYFYHIRTYPSSTSAFEHFKFP